jgi:hypothetical protein
MNMAPTTGSLQRYSNSQIGDWRTNVPIRDLEKEVGLQIRTPSEVQDASKVLKGSHGVVHGHAVPLNPPQPKVDISKYQQSVPKSVYEKVGRSPTTSGTVIGHNLGRALAEESPEAAALDVGAAGATAVAPWLPRNIPIPIGKTKLNIPARAIAESIGLIPVAKSVVEQVIPQKKAKGGLAHLADGGGKFGAAADIAQKAVNLGKRAIGAFDPRFDKRVGEIPKLKDMVLHTEQYGPKEVPNIYLPDYEGHPFITSISDRSHGGAQLHGINDVMFKRPVDLTGGKLYMYNHPGNVWAAGDVPADNLMRQANALKDFTGKDPLYLPWQMAPTGSDFSHMTGQTMLSYAESAMPKGEKKNLDKYMKNIIPDWKGIDHPESLDQFLSAPAGVRGAVQDMMDKNFRDAGGIGIGQARLAIADPEQHIGRDGSVSHVGRIFAGQDPIRNTGNASYPSGIPGEGLGKIPEDFNIYQFLTEKAANRNVLDPANPTRPDLRSIEVFPASGILTEKALMNMGFAEGGSVDHLAGGGIPENIVKAYKLFKTKGGNTNELYPLFVNANKPVPLGEWVNAEVGPVAASGKVKSKLGELAYRPGWHAGDLPVATHIGGKSEPSLKAPDYRRPDEVWAEVEMPADVDWQSVANQRARLNKAGQPIASTAHITDQIPEGGFYRYKTSPNMQGNWLIGGGMKVNKVLTDEEVQAINEAAGAADLPRFTPLPGKAEGGAISPLEMFLKSRGYKS